MQVLGGTRAQISNYEVFSSQRQIKNMRTGRLILYFESSFTQMKGSWNSPKMVEFIKI